MPIYIKYGDIKGDVTAEGHKGSDGWVEVNSFQFGIGRGIASPTGGSSDRESSAPSVSEIVVTKPMDKSSFSWMEKSLWGEGEDVQIDFCKTDKDKLEVYTTYKLKDAMVSRLLGLQRRRPPLGVDLAQFHRDRVRVQRDEEQEREGRVAQDRLEHRRGEEGVVNALPAPRPAGSRSHPTPRNPTAADRVPRSPRGRLSGGFHPNAAELGDLRWA